MLRRLSSGKTRKFSHCLRIDGRSDVIDHKRCYVDWEGDMIVGNGYRSALLTMIE